MDKKWYVTFKVDKLIEICGECPMNHGDCLASSYGDKPCTHDYCKLKSQVPVMVKEIIKEKKLCDDCVDSLECSEYGLIKECAAKRVLVNSHAGMEF